MLDVFQSCCWPGIDETVLFLNSDGISYTFYVTHHWFVNEI